jgi:hypothetical protein
MLTQLPRGLRLLLRRPERICVLRRDDPAKRPGLATNRARKENVKAGSERARQNPNDLPPIFGWVGSVDVDSSAIYGS